MKHERFSPASPGSLVPITLHRERMKSSGKTEIEAVKSLSFVPDPLPPRIDWRAIRADLFEELTAATSALARVNGLVTIVPNVQILTHTLWLREAKLSSEIENIHTTALDMVLAGTKEGQSESSAAREAWNAMKAVELAIESDIPFSGRLIRDMHRRLLDGVRGADKRPGEYRDIPVYIGPRNKPDQARYVPPPPGHLPGQVVDCMSRLEHFAHSDWGDIPDIAGIAVLHYQFEAIHPFRDGNGRIGRALILQQLNTRGLLDSPVTSVSGHFQKYRQEYVDRMFAVSAEGDWAGWIQFFAEAVASEAAMTRSLAERVVHLRRKYNKVLREDASTPARLMNLLDHVLSWPVVNARSVATLLGVTDPTARKDISRFENLGLLRPTEQVTYGKMWYAPEVLAIIETTDLESDGKNPSSN